MGDRLRFFRVGGKTHLFGHPIDGLAAEPTPQRIRVDLRQVKLLRLVSAVGKDTLEYAQEAPAAYVLATIGDRQLAIAVRALDRRGRGRRQSPFVCVPGDGLDQESPRGARTCPLGRRRAMLSDLAGVGEQFYHPPRDLVFAEVAILPVALEGYLHKARELLSVLGPAPVSYVLHDDRLDSARPVGRQIAGVQSHFEARPLIRVRKDFSLGDHRVAPRSGPGQSSSGSPASAMLAMRSSFALAHRS